MPPFTSLDPAVRRAAERERRIARGRAEAAEAPLAVALSGHDRGNGGPPALTPLEEFSAIAELLYGTRWTTDVARDLEHSDGRTVRRWKAGEAQIAPTDLAHLRRIARKRAEEITRLVGDRLDEPAPPKRDPVEIRARFEALMAEPRPRPRAGCFLTESRFTGRFWSGCLSALQRRAMWDDAALFGGFTRAGSGPR